MRLHTESQLRIFEELFGEGGSSSPEEIYGGGERVADLDNFFSALRRATDRDVKLVVVSHGYTPTVRRALESADLLRHFDGVVGVDHPTAVQCQSDKARISVQLMKQFGVVNGAEAILIDDDHRNLVHTRKHCQTYWVYEREGMTRHEMATILAWVRCVPAPSYGTPFDASNFLTAPAAEAVSFSEDKVVPLSAPVSSLLKQLSTMEYTSLGRQCSSLDAAVALCNSVPPHCIVERPKLLAITERGVKLYYILYTAKPDLDRFLDMVAVAIRVVQEVYNAAGEVVSEEDALETFRADIAAHFATFEVAGGKKEEQKEEEEGQRSKNASPVQSKKEGVVPNAAVVLDGTKTRKQAAELAAASLKTPGAELEARGSHIEILLEAITVCLFFFRFCCLVHLIFTPRTGPYRPNPTHFSQPLRAIRAYTRGKNQVVSVTVNEKKTTP